MNFFNYVLGAIAIYAVVILLVIPWVVIFFIRMPCKYQGVFLSPEEVLARGNGQFKAVVAAIQEEGFRIGTAGSVETLKGVHAESISFERDDDPCRIAVTIRRTNGQEVVILEFIQRYEDGRWLVLCNMTDPPLPMSRHILWYQLPGEQNVKLMARMFRQLRVTMGAAPPVDLRGQQGSLAVLDLLNKELYHWCRAGYFSMKCRNGYRRIGILFAYRAALLSNWPAKPVFHAMLRRKTHAAIAKE